ncbi:hypothetical protein U8527_05525 [Kordia algicida OT-1]|uniref:Uncharacterized protein n=1 Tax=Kordia algicida OT-1 TaxID=391587 RepID=A9DMT9_9FLAO|nr:hypothetical protein [Kordia algicida]EDP97785.1 hypothetical protein KAOT1_21522 [Kordia algicida OT-1]
MKFSLTLLSLFLIGSIHFVNAQKADPSKEPKAGMVVTVNGKDYKISEGEKVQHDGNTISVTLANSKTFNNGTVSFDYPTSFGFEYETSFGYKNWTFDGNNFVIMYFEIAEGTVDGFVEEISGRFGKQNCKIEKTSLKLGSRELFGKRINVNLMGERLTLDLLEIKMKDGITRIIAFQDSCDEYGNATDEGKETIKMIDKSIMYKK